MLPQITLQEGRGGTVILMVTGNIFVRKSAKIRFFCDLSQHHVSGYSFFSPFVPKFDFLYSDLFIFFFIIFSRDYLVNKDFNFATVYSMPIQLPFIAPRG